MKPGDSDQAEARDLAFRLAGPAGADQLLEEARQQVAAIVAKENFELTLNTSPSSCCAGASVTARRSAN